MTMLEEFVKWMASLPEFEREQKMDILINLFAPNPSHEDFKRLKGALKRKEKRILQLEAEKKKTQKPTFEELCASIYSGPDFQNLKKRIVVAYLYRNLAEQNKKLRRKNKELQADIKQLVYKLNQPINM